MDDAVRQRFRAELDEIEGAGLTKHERVIESPQGPTITVGGRTVLNFCANNYLGLADDPRLVRAAQEGLERGASACRASGSSAAPRTSTRSSRRRSRASSGPRTRSSTPPASTPTAGCSRRCSASEDAVISDALNHASIIDGIRLCKAQRYRYAHGDMADLERLLRGHGGRADAASSRPTASSPWTATSPPCARSATWPSGTGALVMVDDSHATGFFGPTGRGTPEHCGVSGRVDIVTSTLGKALGGASGGFTTRRGARSSSCCASARGPTSSPTRSRRRSWAPSLACLDAARRRAPSSATASRPTRAASARR